MSVCLKYPSAIPLPLMLRSSSEGHQAHLSDPGADLKNTTEDSHWLFCLNCRAKITSRDQEVSVANGHFHTFTNPTGLIFRLGCFAAAAGCLFHGEPTTLHSWFTGYTWKYADCANCRAHLGWQFVNHEKDHCFSGLIISRLTTSQN